MNDKSLQFEEAVMGGLLIKPEKLPDLTKMGLMSEAFFHSAMREIFKAICALSEDHNGIDVLTVKLKLDETNKLDVVTEAELYRLASETPSAANIETHAKGAIDAYRRRQIVSHLKNSISAFEGNDPHAIENLKNDLLLIDSLCSAASYEHKIRVVNLSQFLSMKLKPRELIMSPWLPEQGLAMIYALPGVGKTHLSLNVAYAIASGSNFLCWSVESPRRVLFIDGEMSGADLQMRLSSIAASYEKDMSGDNFRLLTPDLQPLTLLDLSTLKGQYSLEPFLDGIEVIVVDNISCLCRTGRENESESWNVVQEWALWMRASGRSVIFIHHASKNGSQRGTSKRLDVLDTCIRLQRPADHQASDGACFELHFEKNRGFSGKSAESMLIELQLNSNGTQRWQFQALENSTFDKVVTLFNSGVTVQKDIADEVGVHNSVVSKHLKKAREGGLIDART